jgi:hypothetical protein
MAENKLEEAIDLLAEYGGFNREYLRDKLLTRRSKPKNKSEAENKMTMEEIQRYIFDKRCQGNPPKTPREIYDCLQLAYEYGRMSMTYVYPSQSKEKNDGRE